MKTLLRACVPPLAALVVVVLLLAVAQRTGPKVARADMAPFPAEPGTTLGTAGTTDIRMLSETVVLAVTDIVVTNSSGAGYTQTGALVTADFLLNNPAASTQSLQVGFPLEVPSHASDYGDFLRLHDLRAFVGSQEMPTNLATIQNETWSAWKMDFAPGDNHVRVTYQLPATVDACNTEIGYVLHTGAAWAGSIGHVDLIVRFPYAAEATFVSPHGIYLGDSTPGYKVEGSDLHWHYDNLEPTPANDLAVTFVNPDCWLTVAAARNAVSQSPTADNYDKLANAYADIVFPHHGFDSPLIAQVAEAQYQKALALDPQNPQINADYAEFLLNQYGGDLLPSDSQSRVTQQCARALFLDPSDDVLNSTCAYFLQSDIGDPNVSDNDQATAAAVLTVVANQPPPTETAAAATDTPPAPSASPSPAPSASPQPSTTAEPTLAPAPTASPQPAPTATPLAVAQVSPTPPPPTAPPTPVPAANTAAPFVAAALVVVVLGAVVLVLIVGGLFLWRGRRKG